MEVGGRKFIRSHLAVNKEWSRARASGLPLVQRLGNWEKPEGRYGKEKCISSRWPEKRGEAIYNSLGMVIKERCGTLGLRKPLTQTYPQGKRTNEGRS